MEEIWKDIPLYEGVYQASNLGRIKSVERVALKNYRGNRIVKERIMLGTVNRDGYLKVHFKHNDINKGYFIHRLIAQTFIPNPLNKPQVNHKDGNKLNNSVNNLEWVTNLENQQHAVRMGLKSHKTVNNKSIEKYDMCDNFIECYNSLTLASKVNKISIGNLSSCCNGKRNSAGGFKWRFKNAV